MDSTSDHEQAAAVADGSAVNLDASDDKMAVDQTSEDGTLRFGWLVNDLGEDSESAVSVSPRSPQARHPLGMHWYTRKDWWRV